MGFHTELERAIGPCENLLDLGCGAASPLGRLPRTFHRVGLDCFEPSLAASARAGIHDESILGDVFDAATLFKPKSFDVVCALDFIEHLSQADGYRLIEMMESLARKRMVIFTPNGFVPQAPCHGNENQVHLSGWSVEMMRQAGFQDIVGINGLKWLRGERAEISWRPRFFWRPVSQLSQLVVRRRPHLAFQLLCVKRLEG